MMACQLLCSDLTLLGRLFDRVDLIKPVSNVSPSVCAYVRACLCVYVCPSTKSFFDFSEIWHVRRGRWVMHDGMQYDPMQGQGRKPFKVGNPAIFKSYLLRHLQRELATDHWFLNWGILSKVGQAGFLIIVLDFVSCDFELGKNVSCDELIISPTWGFGL